MREFRPYGSVRAVLGNWHPYRDVCSGEAGQAAVDVVAILVKHEFQSTAGRLDARLPHEVLARLKLAAEIQGRTLTDFVVAAADEAACRAIERTEVIRLSREGQEQFARMLIKPPMPKPALVRAFKRHRSLIEK